MFDDKVKAAFKFKCSVTLFAVVLPRLCPCVQMLKGTYNPGALTANPFPAGWAAFAYYTINCLGFILSYTIK